MINNNHHSSAKIANIEERTNWWCLFYEGQWWCWCIPLNFIASAAGSIQKMIIDEDEGGGEEKDEDVDDDWWYKL